MTPVVQNQVIPERASMDDELQLAFTPLHKTCLGAAVGVALAVLVFAATLVHIGRSPAEVYPLALLAQYFPAYTVSFPGAFVGAAYGFFVGFVLGWFFAFARNVVVAITKAIFRARAEMAENRGFLDHI